MDHSYNDNNDSLWYKDGIIYQVHIKAYHDSSNDGIGDIPGLIKKLDYIKSLGVTIIWVLPFYPSPLRDDGYDIADYMNINPDYGTLEDFRKFLKEAHKRGLKVITELVLNHTSEQHELFQRARKSPPGSPQRDFYVWSDTPEKYKDSRIIFQDFETSNWSWDPVAKAYYWHRFYWHQPDLNFDNPEVHKYFSKIVDFWFEMGVDGMRLDAVPYLYEREGTNCENLPETHTYLKKLSAHVTSKYKNKMLLAEANQWPEDAVAYFGNGDECHMAFHFPLMPRIYMAVQMETRFPIIDILEQTPSIPENCQWAMFLRNHDELTLEMVTDEERDYMYRFFAKDSKARINLGIRRRLAPLVDNNRRKIELLNILLFSFPGTPVIYYGDEIGMGDNYYLGDRNGVRTPMQWSPDRNAGFSRVNPQKLFLPVIIDPEYHYEAINVSVQQHNPSSLLWWVRRAISIRNHYKAFGRGTLEFLSPDNPKVLSFFRKYKDEIILVVVNLSRFAQVVELDLKEYEGYTPVELFSRNNFPEIRNSLYMFTLNAYDHYWFEIEKKDVSAAVNLETDVDQGEAQPHQINSLEEIISSAKQDDFFLNYLKKADLLSLEDKIEGLEVYEEIEISEDSRCVIVILQINFLDIAPEYFLLPLSIVEGEQAQRYLTDHKNELITRFLYDNKELLLVNGVFDEIFREKLYKFINKKQYKGHRGKIIFHTEKRIKNLLLNEYKSSGVRLTDENSFEITYNDAFVLKLYRKIDEGINPGEEIQEYLTSNTSFYNIRPFGGSLAFIDETGMYSLGLIKEHVHTEQSAWDYFLDGSISFFEQVESGENIKVFTPEPVAALFNNLTNAKLEVCSTVDGIYIEMIKQIGTITGDFHTGLAEAKKAEFKPEEFSMLYQRSLYQSMRTNLRDTLRIANKNLSGYISPVQEDLQYLVRNEQKIIDYLRHIIEGKIASLKIRIHGNLHLANIFFTGKNFIFINFEGPSSVPPSERRLKRSPLRDVASIISSLYFTAFTGMNRMKTSRTLDPGILESYAEEWWLCLSSNFLKSYLDTVREGIFIPEEKKELEYLLKIYVIEKITIELKNCLQNDPANTFISARALRKMLDTL